MKTFFDPAIVLADRRFYFWFVLGFLLLLVIQPGCLEEKKPVLLVDYAHGEIFMPLDPRELGYLELNFVFEEAGYELKVISEPLTEKDLSQARVYLLAGPMRGLTKDELDVVRNFVSKGGKVIVLTHISMPLKEFLDEYDTSMGWVLAEEENTLERPHDFVVKNIGDAEILKDVKSLSFYGAFSVKAPNEYAHTSAKAFEDINMNGLRDKDESLGSFALVGVAKHGSGYVVTIGDDAILANRFIKEEDNFVFAKNLAEWGLK